METERGDRSTAWTWLGRSVLWAAASCTALVLGAMLLGAGLGAWAMVVRGTPSLTPLQVAVGRALLQGLLLQVLLPQLLATGVTWAVLARLRPRLDGSWRTLLPGLAGVAALWFAPIGAWGFPMWSPGGPRDVAATVVLTAGACVLALALPRRWIPALAPGRLARSRG